MAYDFDSYLKKKGINEQSAPVERPKGSMDAVVDRIEEAEAKDQGYTLDEYRDLKRKSQEYYEQRRKVKKEKGIGDYAEDAVRAVADQPFLRSFSRGATAGLSEPVAAGISSLILKGMGEDASLKDVYSDVAGGQREDLAQMEQEHPWQTAGGELAGVAAPGGAFSRIFGAAGKAAPALALGKDASMAQRIGAKAMEAGTRGGLANIGYGAAKEASSEAIGEEKDWNPALDFGLGAVGDIAMLPVEKALGTFASSKNVKNFIENSPVGKLFSGGREQAEAAARDTYQAKKDIYDALEVERKAKFDTDFENQKGAYKANERARRDKFDTDFENQKEAYKTSEQQRTMQAEADAKIKKDEIVESFKDLIKNDPTPSAQKVFQKIKSADLKLGKEYGEVVDPIMGKYRLRKVDSTPFKNQVDDILNRFGVVDEAGNVDLKSMEGFLDFDAESKGLIDKLVSFKEGLTPETSISQLERGVKALQKAANFKKGTGYRSAGEETLGDLSRRLKDFLTDQISTFASPDEVAALQGAKAKFAEGKRILKEPLKVVGRFESKPARIARNFQSQFPDTTMQDLMKLDPSMKDEFSDLFLSNLVGSSTSPRKFSKEINYFGGDPTGESRNLELLKNILGDERFAGLEASEKALHEAAVPWQKNYVPEPAPRKSRFESAPAPRKGSYIPEAPPQLADIPPGKVEEFYDLLSSLARSPGKAKTKLGAESTPPFLDVLAPFLSPRLQEQLSNR